jgi:uncharacterized Fe-S cluster-containing radical SAM superfamily protein
MIVRQITNALGARGFVIGLTHDEIDRLKQEHFVLIDVSKKGYEVDAFTLVCAGSDDDIATMLKIERAPTTNIITLERP